MSRTYRRVPGHISVNSGHEHDYDGWDVEYIVRLKRGLSTLEKLRWPQGDGFWGWSDDTPCSSKGMKWTKRFTSKYRRRRAERSLKEELLELEENGMY